MIIILYVYNIQLSLMYHLTFAQDSCSNTHTSRTHTYDTYPHTYIHLYKYQDKANMHGMKKMKNERGKIYTWKDSFKFNLGMYVR